MISGYLEVHTTIDSREAAQKIAEAIVAKRLAACVQVSGPITSTYWWQGKIDHTEEWVCTAKTTRDLYNDLEQAIRETHTYDTPEILAVPLIAGSRSYFDWIDAEIKASANDNADYSETKEQLIQELIEVHEQLIEAATKAQARHPKPRGQWGPREVLAHVAGWEAHAAVRIPPIVEGMAPPIYADDAQHAMLDDATNAAVITLLGDQAFDTVRNILRQAYQRDIQMLKTLDESAFVPGSYVQTRIKAAIDHVRTHREKLEESQ